MRKLLTITLMASSVGFGIENDSHIGLVFNLDYPVSLKCIDDVLKSNNGISKKTIVGSTFSFFANEYFVTLKNDFNNNQVVRYNLDIDGQHLS